MAKRVARPPAPAVLTLPPDATFKVQVLPPEKMPGAWDRWRPYAYYVLGGVLTIAGLMAFFWLVPIEYSPALSHPDAPQLAIALTYPRYIARGDEGTIEMTVTNVSTQAISGTVVLAFGDVPAVRVGEDSSNTMKLDRLVSGGKQSLRVRYSLAQAPTFGSGSLEFTPRATIEGSGSADFAPAQRVDIAFVPLLRTILPGMILGVLGLFWDPIKKWLFPSG